ncbi:MAG: hypothetical protein PSX81_07715 [bacterium]|nr:hypothetical protein [bacterium]
MAKAIVTAIARPSFRQSRLAIPRLTQFAFAKDRQKQNQLNLLQHNNMVWRDGATIVRISLRSVRSASLRQHGIVKFQGHYIEKLARCNLQRMIFKQVIK